MRRSATHILLAVGCIGGSLSLTMCGGGSESSLTSTSTGCPMGICGPGSTSSGMGGSSSSGMSTTSGGGMTTSSTTMSTTSGGGMTTSSTTMSGSMSTSSSTSATTTNSTS